MATLKRYNHLPKSFYQAPSAARTTMTLKQWQETALYTEGEILATGHVWKLVGKQLAPGVYLITAKQLQVPVASPTLNPAQHDGGTNM